MYFEDLWILWVFVGGLICLATSVSHGFGGDAPARPVDGVKQHLLLHPQPGNPRNSEGDLLQLTSGEWLLVWTAFTEGSGADHDPASLRSMRFDEHTASWSLARTIVFPESGMNVMSVSLRRLPDQRIALFYLRKRSIVDCQPVVRFSSDEGVSWSDPVSVVPEEDVGYDVLNNDRVLLTPAGELILPVARHAGVGMSPEFAAAGRLRCYRSSDAGASWTCGAWAPEVPGVMLQEPGLFIDEAGSLRMYARTNAGTQYVTRSDDGGKTFERPQPWTLRSPLSPATVRRLTDGRLLAIWNESSESSDVSRAPRTPLVAAISRNDGASWGKRHTLFQHEDGWYCYVSVDQSGGELLLTTCAGDRRTGNGLQSLTVVALPLSHLGDPSSDEIAAPQPR